MTHYPPLRERVLANLIIQPDGCVVWAGAKQSRGYGTITAARPRRTILVHRLMYEWFAGPIPEGLEIDHLCRNRACANVAHLEVVTSRANTLRGTGIAAVNAAKTECLRGHSLEGVPMRTWPNGKSERRCQPCARLRSQVYRERNRGL